MNGNVIDTMTNANNQTEGYLSIPATTIGTSLSSDTLTESTLSGPSSPSNLSACTLVGSTGSSAAQEKTNDTNNAEAAASAAAGNDDSKPFRYGTAPTAPLLERKSPKTNVSTKDSSILTHSLPPTVTTTHYSESAGGSAAKLLQSHQNPCRKNSNSIDSEIVPSKLNTTRHLSIGSVMQSNGGQQIPMDRRPSAGANIIPQAALCQHRHSLQLNNGGAPLSGGQGSDTGAIKVK